MILKSNGMVAFLAITFPHQTLDLGKEEEFTYVKYNERTSPNRNTSIQFYKVLCINIPHQTKLSWVHIFNYIPERCNAFL